MRVQETVLQLVSSTVKSQHSGTHNGKDLSQDIEGRPLVIIEDILDSGVTLSYLLKYLENRKPSSVEIYTLFNKPERRKKEVPLAMHGFIIPDAFIVGYGLDYDERYRNLPYVGVLKPEVYTK